MDAPICKSCGAEANAHACPNEVAAENATLRAEVERLKDQGRTACDLFDELKAAQLEVIEAERKGRDLCQQNGELLTFLHKLKEEFCGWTCPTVWKTAEGQPHDQRCKDLRAMLDPTKIPNPNCVCGVAANQHGGCRNYRPNVPCPSTYTHSGLGKLACEKDKGHLDRIGDVEHRRGQTIWMSL